MLEVPGDAYPLAKDLAVVAKGVSGKAEWQLLAAPGVVPAHEAAVRAYVGRRWPLPDRALLPALAETYGLTTLVGGGSYLDLPRLERVMNFEAPYMPAILLKLPYLAGQERYLPHLVDMRVQ